MAHDPDLWQELGDAISSGKENQIKLAAEKKGKKLRRVWTDMTMGDFVGWCLIDSDNEIEWGKVQPLHLRSMEQYLNDEG